MVGVLENRVRLQNREARFGEMWVKSKFVFSS